MNFIIFYCERYKTKRRINCPQYLVPLSRRENYFVILYIFASRTYKLVIAIISVNNGNSGNTTYLILRNEVLQLVINRRLIFIKLTRIFRCFYTINGEQSDVCSCVCQINEMNGIERGINYL